MFELRPHQQLGVTLALEKAAGSATTMIIAPGGGKTVSSLAILDALYKADRIDAAIVMVPRLGLCSQYELDWRSIRSNFGPGAMGEIAHKPNESLSLSSGQFGYVTSYASICSNPAVHMQFIRRHAGRVALVCDEAHYLGMKGLTGESATKAAGIISAMGERAHAKIPMSGTPYRSDGNPLVFVEYENDLIRSDVHLGYRDGVAQGFLRPFEAQLFEADIAMQIVHEGVKHNVTVTSRVLDKGFKKVCQDPGLWEPVTDSLLNKVREMQELWPAYCGLIGAATQDHAREVIHYLRRKGARCLLAVSDDAKSHDNLREFKRGGYDVMVTVGMCHVGYDYKPIIAVAALGGTREHNWLDQFSMRAGRMVSERPEDEQTAWLYGLDDPLMRKFVNNKRNESQRGIDIRGRAGQEERWGDGLHKTQRNSIEVLDVSLTQDVRSMRADGTDQNRRVDLNEYTDVWATDTENRNALRSWLRNLAGKSAYKQYGNATGETLQQVYATLKMRFGKAVKECTVDELIVRIKYLERELGLDREDAVDWAEPEAKTEEEIVQLSLFG